MIKSERSSVSGFARRQRIPPLLAILAIVVVAPPLRLTADSPERPSKEYALPLPPIPVSDIFSTPSAAPAVELKPDPTQGPAITLVSADMPSCPIIVATTAHNQTNETANTLADILGQMTGVTFPVTPFLAGTSLPERCIVIGNEWVSVPDTVGDYGFITKVIDGRLHIAGRNRLSTCTGVYRFLENELGCRWWTHNEHHIPNHSSIVLTVDRVDRPAFPYGVYLMNKEATINPFMFGTLNSHFYPFLYVHNLPNLLKPLTRKHPDFIPMNQRGQRAWNNIHLNYTAPDMAEALADVLGNEIAGRHARKENADYWIYNVDMGDSWGNFDFSSESQAMYDSEAWTDPDGRVKKAYMAPLLKMLNETAERLHPKYPNLKLGTIAYFGLESPPKTIVPHDIVHIRIARHRKTTVKSIEQTTTNQSFRRNLDKWLEIAPGRVHVWEYGTNYFNFLYPFPCLRAIAANIKLYHKLGVVGILIQGNYNTTGGHLVALQNFVWRHLLWDPTLDTEQLINEFCDGYYGPASAHVLEYLTRLEAAVWPPKPAKPVFTTEMSDPRSDYLTLELVADLRAILERALVAASDSHDAPTFTRRVRELLACVDAAQYWRKENEGPADRFIEKDGKLIRRDFQDYTYDRIEAMLPYLRDASDNEWGLAHARQMYQLRLHGGPIHTVSNDSLALTVKPAQSGVMGPLTYDGVDCFINTQTYTQRGRLTVATVDEPPTRHSLTMSGPGGISLWRIWNFHDLHHTVRVDRNRLTINQDVSLVRLDKEHKNLVRSVSETRYKVNDNLSDFSLSVWSETARKWTPLDLSDLPAIPFPERPKSEADWPKLQFHGLDGRFRIYRPGVALQDAYELVEQTPQAFDPENPKPADSKPVWRLDVMLNKEQGIAKTIVTMGLIELQYGERTPVMTRTVTCKKRR